MYINLISEDGSIEKTLDCYPIKDNEGKNIAFYDKNSQEVYPKGSMDDLRKKEFYIEQDVYTKEYWKHILYGILDQYPEALQIALDYKSKKKPKQFVVRKFYHKATKKFEDVLLYVETPRNDKEVIDRKSVV